jgi:hypothetical protein
MMGGKSGAFRGFSSSCSPYIHTIISSYSHNNNLRNVVMPSRHTKTHACESGRMFPKWTERVNQVRASLLNYTATHRKNPPSGYVRYFFHFAGNDRIGNIRAVERPAGHGLKSWALSVRELLEIPKLFTPLGRTCRKNEGVSAMTLEEKRKRKRDPEGWVWRYHGGAEGKKGSKPAVLVEDVKKYPTRSAA